MSARITRSQAKAQIAAPVKTRKPQCQNSPNIEASLAAREVALLKKEAELAARELDLAIKELELYNKEAELEKREAALNAKPTKKGKQFMIIYSSEFQGMDTQTEVFISSDEKTAALATFDWMVKNREGLDFEMGLCALKEEGDDRFEDEEELAANVRKSCNSFEDLYKICERFGNSYFEDYDGWKLKFSQK